MAKHNISHDLPIRTHFILITFYVSPQTASLPNDSKTIEPFQCDAPDYKGPDKQVIISA